MSELPKTVWILGITGGIGEAFAKYLCEHSPSTQVIGFARDPSKADSRYCSLCLPLDFENLSESPCISDIFQEFDSKIAPDWLFIATGWLHDQTFKPEKTYKQMSAEHMLRSYQINAIGPTLFVQAFLNHFGVRAQSKIGILSARLGSISDNQVGGWHSYRASKSALNMLIKNYSIELKRSRSKISIFAIQPGTTDTALSKPFQKNLPAGQLQPPEFTAEKVAALFEIFDLQNSGEFFDFLGQKIAP